jgi:predicted negative regulator of RcsB-dependent stress response
MSKYNRKQRTPKEDEFVSFWARVFQRVEPYFGTIGVTLATAFVIVLAVWGFSAWREHKAEAAAEQFGRAVKIYDADLLGDTPAPKSDEENPVPRFKTAKERAEATLAELDRLDKEFAGSISKDAILFRAGVLYDLGRFDDAEQTYRKFLDSAKANEAMSAVAREGVGLSFEMRGKLDEALAEYQKIDPKTGDFYRDRAVYDQARVYIKKGDKKKAADLYRSVLAKMPSSGMREEIQNQLADLEGT